MNIIKRALFVLLILIAGLSAQPYGQKLQNAARSIDSVSKSTVWKGYHQYQSLYMKGLLENNRTLQIEALRGLVRASSKLGLDPTRYKNALRLIEPKNPQKKKSKAAKSSRSAKEKKSETQKRDRVVHLLEYDMKKIAKIAGLTMGDKALNVTLSRPFSKKNVHHFVLKRKARYLYVFDIAPVRAPFSIKRYKGGAVKEVRIAQYDPKKVRIVIETKKKYKPSVDIKDRKMTISLPAHKKRVKTTHYTQKKKAPGKADRKRSHIPMRIYTVVIDPGHGGKDSGAVGYHRKMEKDAVLAIAKDLAKILKKRGFRVYLTRNSDRFISLKERTRMANRKNADFFISIHANAVPKRRDFLKSKGIETYFLSPARTARAKRVAALENRADIANIDYFTKNDYLHMLNREKIIKSNKLAMDIQDQMLKSVRKKYRNVLDNGVRNGPFWVLVGAQMPAVLIETGFITNPTEAKRLFNPYYRKLLAQGIANGIANYIYRNKE
ncbi:N-acetylmuramoyl-L-alanine amidase [Hydrogenimonas sp.]